MKRIAAWTACLAIVWPIQYFAIVPAILAWRATVWTVKAASTIGCVGVLLLCLPIIGWVIIALMVWSKRSSDARMRELTAAMQQIAGPHADPGIPSRSIWRPWLKDQLAA